MNHLDLFSGIGGFSLAARWAYGDEHKPIAFCEIDKYCQKVLKKHWPEVPIFEDIRSLDGRQFRDVDLVSGGDPCQPHSSAGKRRGKKDDRYLWPEMLRIISEARPTWVINENVAGSVTNGVFQQKINDLESIEFDTQAYLIPALAVNAPHRRDRIWLVANSKSQGLEGQKSTGRICTDGLLAELCFDLAYPEGWRLPKRITKETIQHNAERGGLPERRDIGEWWNFEPGVDRVATRIPNRVDRVKALGNAIVPQVAYILLRMIKAIDEQEKARENMAVGCSPAKI